MAIEYVDATQLDTDLTSVANAIRAKSGGSGQLAFPAGFVSEIGNIPSGGGGNTVELDSDYITLRAAIVTVGSNSVTRATQIYAYLLGLAGFPTTGFNCAWYGVVDHTGAWANNAAACQDITTSSLFGDVASSRFYRNRNGAFTSTPVSNNYDASITAGDKYLVSALYWKGAPTV